MVHSQQQGIKGTVAGSHNTLDWAWYEWLHQPILWVHGYHAMEAADFVKALGDMDSEAIVFLPKLYQLEGALPPDLHARAQLAEAQVESQCRAQWPSTG